MSGEPIVYVVDDIEANRDLLITLLKKNSFNTSEFDNATTFLEQVDTSRPGCILLDIRIREWMVSRL